MTGEEAKLAAALLEVVRAARDVIEEAHLTEEGYYVPDVQTVDDLKRSLAALDALVLDAAEVDAMLGALGRRDIRAVRAIGLAALTRDKPKPP